MAEEEAAPDAADAATVEEEPPKPPPEKMMKAMLSKHGTFAYHSRVNPRPVDWWGKPEDPSYSLLRDCFRGRANLVTRYKTETFVPNIGSPPVTKEVPYTALVAQCLSHKNIVEAPRLYAAACDEDTGIKCIHACCFNGYSETLKVLLEAGGNDARDKTSDGIDCWFIARGRGNDRCLIVLDAAEAARVAKEAALAKAPDELARERRKRREAEMRRRKMAAQQKAEEARREMLQAEAEKLRKRREEEKAWKRLGVIPTRRVTWKGMVVDVDGTRGIGYYPKILRDLPKAPPK